MEVLLTYGNISKAVRLPMSPFKVTDTLDQLRAEGTSVCAKILECHEVRELEEWSMSGGLPALNEFARRLSSFSSKECAVVCALTLDRLEITPEELLDITEAVGSVPVQRCGGTSAMRRIAQEHGCAAEFDQIASKRPRVEAVQKLFREHCGGVLVDGYFVETSAHRRPDVPAALPEQDTGMIRILVAQPQPDQPLIRETAVWVTMPCEPEMLAPLQRPDCMLIGIYEFGSVLPHLSPSIISYYAPETINAFAKRLSQLDRSACVKLKAVIQAEHIFDDIGKILDCIDHLDAYEFDPAIWDGTEFAQAFLSRNPDHPSVPEDRLHTFGLRLLHETLHGDITDYGAVSSRGMALYSVPSTEQAEEVAEECGMVPNDLS